MKKILIILVCSGMLLTGCTKVDSNNTDYKQLITNCLNNKIVTNNVSLGYKFYVPRGVKLIKNYDYNQSFLIDNNYIYLYVDIISYYYKNELNHNDETNYYYYQNFSSNDKYGYIAIKENNNSTYYVKLVYNYGKIEFYAYKNDLAKLISLSTIILNNIEYNDIVIEKILENNSGNFSDVRYKVDKPEDASSDFSQFLEEYVQEESDSETEEVLPDE